MTITLEHLAEPTLQFGHYFEHQDTKTGLAEYGPFGQNIEGLHPSEIKLGFVGTRETIAGAKAWIDECSRPIESENVKTVGSAHQSESGGLFGEEPGTDQRSKRINKILNRDFVGFNADSPYHCRFLSNERWDRTFTPRELERILLIPEKERRIWTLVDFFDQQVESLATTVPAPSIIILALTPEIVELADTIQLSGNFYLNFRRAIKARAMRWGIPLQILQRRTTLGKDPRLQEKTLRAWNFCTALYYKAQGVPWRPTNLAQDTCYIGISFYVARDLNEQLSVRASVAQAFDYLGQGLVLRGEPFDWNEEQQGKSPHLTRTAAASLLRDTTEAYTRLRRVPPRRVVIHKTSEFWGEEHGSYNERDGICEGIEAVAQHCEIDLVTLRPAGLHLFREGNYPPLRGTYFTLEDQHFLYTSGFTPYLETYPGSYVPVPWHLAARHGGSDPKDLLREVLALTKMNVNNCSFADGTPITLSFAQMVGEIMKHVPDGGKVQPTYQFYM